MEDPGSTTTTNRPPGPRHTRRRRLSVWRILGGLGRLLLALGVLLLLFSAYLLWGTGLSEAGHQHDLRNQFDRALRAAAAPPPVSGTATTLPKGLAAQLAAGVAPDGGQPVALLEIPKLNLQKVVVEGTSEDDLRLGPGHYTGTPLPGQPGNVAIAGHRTTYGAPFYNLDQLHQGDDVVTTTLQGRFVYRVIRSEVVSPADNSVLESTNTPTLTLTTCNPRYSASQRLVVQAGLVSSVAPAPSGAAAAPTSRKGTRSADLAGTTGGWSAAILWGLLTLAGGTGVWLACRRVKGRTRWAAYAVGALPVLVALFFFYANLSPLLPASF